MKIIANLFCFTTILIVFNSCTITKRHFGGGYHVEWKKKWNTEEESVAKKGTMESDTVYALAAPVSKSDEAGPGYSKKKEKVTVSETTSGSESETVSGPANSESTHQSYTSSQDEVITDAEIIREETAEVYSVDITKPEPARKVETLTWVAFGFLLAATVVALLPAAWFSGFTLILVVFVLLLLIAFINAIGSAIRVKRNPEKYKAKGFTWLMVFFCSLGLAFALVLLLLNAFYPL
ncbi:hypothetical protein [Fluviicola chungangensis]|uniref:Uncharacterized protein n=1 Tax=Fluviicola chungangensis TaxID=2597671 RepID=A0A556MYB8_9FLAO|nr:hypothetical protein [Fluviicola chungangensis]TSJ44895.1 hypothetical protein FO442_09870 [Fluviicola chungangensis]